MRSSSQSNLLQYYRCSDGIENQLGENEGSFIFFISPISFQSNYNISSSERKYGTGTLSLGVKRPGREADHWLPSSAEVKEWVELYLYSPNTPSWCCAQFEKKKHRDNFTLTLQDAKDLQITVRRLVHPVL
jgi:hypothetical protein